MKQASRGNILRMTAAVVRHKVCCRERETRIAACSASSRFGSCFSFITLPPPPPPLPSTCSGISTSRQEPNISRCISLGHVSAREPTVPSTALLAEPTPPARLCPHQWEMCKSEQPHELIISATLVSTSFVAISARFQTGNSSQASCPGFDFGCRHRLPKSQRWHKFGGTPCRRRKAGAMVRGSHLFASGLASVSVMRTNFTGCC